MDINEMKDLIVSQQLEIKNLHKKVDDLQDSYERRQEWLLKAKREAGQDIRKSFDDVWKEMLDKPTWDDVKLAIELANKNINRLSMKWTKEDIIREIKKSKTK
jgi:hypothetical protein